MAKVVIHQKVKAPLSVVWPIWDDYGNIDRFHPGLSSSHLVEDETLKTGMGSKRQCNLDDGKNWIQEEIIEYVPKKKIVIDAYAGTMPLKKAIASFEFMPVGARETEIVFHMDFEPKMGLLGKLMIPMMKMKFKNMMGNVLKASAGYAEKQAIVSH